MAYRVVVEIPENLASTQKQAIDYVRCRLEAKGNTNWFAKVKSYSQVVKSEYQGRSTPVIQELEETLNIFRDIIRRMKLEQATPQDKV